MNLSFWENRYINDADICIIGAGLVGMISAIELRRKYPKAKIVIAERGSIGSGASTKNAGFACFGSVGEIRDDIAHRSEEECIALISKRWNGLQRLRSLFKHASDIGLEFHGSYEVFTHEEEDLAKQLSSELEYYNALVKKAIGEEEVFTQRKNIFGFKVCNETIYNRLEGQLDVTKLIRSLHKICQEKDITIVHGFALSSYEEGSRIRLDFDHGLSLMTEQLVFATNAFTKQFFPQLDIVPYRNQLIMTEEIPNLSWKGTFHFKGGLGYFRNVGNRVLLGGRRDIDMENENTIDFGLTSPIQEHLESFMYETLGIDPDISIAHRWSGILAHGKSKSPIIKSISDRVHCAVRLGGMGIAIASNTAKELSELL